jgi:hypothetical protein
MVQPTGKLERPPPNDAAQFDEPLVAPPVTGETAVASPCEKAFPLA